MPHYVIHVGPHKTGTSYLQACLERSAPVLEAAGIHVAARWANSALNASHTGLVDRLNSERLNELETVFAAWRNSVYRMVVISCEALASVALEPVKVQMLYELTAGSPVSIVYYVRRWSHRLASEWQEYVKQGETFQLPEVLVHNLRDPAVSSTINIDVHLRSYAERFGLDAIKLVSFDSVLENGLDLFAHFAGAFLGGMDLPQPCGMPINASLNPAKVELMRVFNCLERESGVDSRALLRFVQLDHTPAPMTALLNHLEGYATTIEVDDDDAPVRQVLADSHAAYAACALAPVPAAGFYAAARTQLAYIRPDYALAPGWAEGVRRLWRDLLAMEDTRPGRRAAAPVALA